MSSSAHQLFLLADHLKLLLLERQRSRALNIDANKQDGQIKRSIASLETGIQQLESQYSDEENPDVTRLKSQLDTLRAQYDGSSITATTAEPNNASLADDFEAAQSRPSRKNVRFTDEPDAEETANRSALFAEQQPYQDEPPDHTELSNQQIHDYHKQVIQDQDTQLGTLSESLGRQRLIGIQMGDELDEQNEMLTDVESGIDRHQSLLDRAGKRLGDVARKSKANWSWITIAILICILVLLLIITK